MALLTRLRNVWRPENFHYHHELRGRNARFEGWYFKVVDRDGRQPYAIIPGVFLGPDAHAFVQVLDGLRAESWYHRFALSEFRADRRRFEVRIGANRFSAGQVDLDIGGADADGGGAVRGSLQLGSWTPWPVRPLSPGVMGPDGFAPLMQCYHGILSLDHEISGGLRVDGRETSYDGGRGYIEKDWGKSFPEGYVWTQSNHFDRPGICVTASVAKIPWVTGSFRGFLVGFLIDGRLLRFTTYSGAKLDLLRIGERHVELRVSDAEHRLEVSAAKSDGGVLHAPYERQMLQRVAETMTSVIELRLTSAAGGNVIYEGTGRVACLELQGRTDQLV